MRSFFIRSSLLFFSLRTRKQIFSNLPYGAARIPLKNYQQDPYQSWRIDLISGESVVINVYMIENKECHFPFWRAPPGYRSLTQKVGKTCLPDRHFFPHCTVRMRSTMGRSPAACLAYTGSIALMKASFSTPVMISQPADTALRIDSSTIFSQSSRW